MSTENSEITPLLSKSPSSDSRAVTIMDWAGFGTTAMAMVPQGFLGGLLADLFMQYTPGYVRFPVDGLFAVSAGLGKERIVRFYNTESFKDLGRKEYWEKVFTLSEWSKWDIINQTWSIIPSAVFSYIGKLSMEGIGNLLAAFNYKWTDLLAAGVRDWRIQLPFMIFPFICNFRGFPYIHKGGVGLIQEAVHYCVENPEYRKLVKEMSSDIDATRKKIKNLFESQDPVKIAEAKKILGKLDLDNKDFEVLRKVLLKNVPEEFREQPEIWKAFISKNILGLAAIGIVMWGFYNFPFIAANMITDLAAFLGLSGSAIISYIAYAAGIMDYLSMSAMSTGVYHTVHDLMNHARGHRVPINILSTPQKTINHSLTALACITGVTPNVYQSLVITKEPIASTVAAGFASAAVEYGGFSALNTERQIKSKIKEDADIKLFYESDKKLLEASDLSKLSEEEIHDLADVFYDTTETEEMDNYDEFSDAPVTGVEVSTPLITGNTTFQPEATFSIANIDSQKKSEFPSQYRPGYLWAKEKVRSAFSCCFWADPASFQPNSLLNTNINYETAPTLT
jgi:hypothetical protein